MNPSGEIVVTAPPVDWEPMFPDVLVPERKTRQAAASDLRAYLSGRTVTMYDPMNNEHNVDVEDSLRIPPGWRALLPTGIRTKLPEGWAALISLRSGMGLKSGLFIPNAPGIVDADYRYEWGIIVQNGSRADVYIDHNDRVAQVRLVPFYVLPWVKGEVAFDTDRMGGYGSTGRG